MINEKMYGLGDEPSAIRELFAYGLARKAEIGEENVFDYSIGNPSVPAPALVKDTMLQLLKMDPVALHAYSPASGLPEVKEAIVGSLRGRYPSRRRGDGGVALLPRIPHLDRGGRLHHRGGAGAAAQLPA